jgi:ribosomal small subunit protein bTHX
MCIFGVSKKKSFNKYIMGKGDKKTRRGKLYIGSSGNTRISKKNASREKTAKVKEAAKK